MSCLGIGWVSRARGGAHVQGTVRTGSDGTARPAHQLAHAAQSVKRKGLYWVVLGRLVDSAVPSLSYAIPAALRDDMRRELPALSRDKGGGYWRMLQYLLLPHREEDRSGRPIISRDTVAAICGCDHKSHPTVIGFLEAFQREVLPGFTYTQARGRWGPSGLPGRARTVTATGLGHLEDAWRRQIIEAYATKHDDLVVMDTGKRVTRQVRADARKRRREIAGRLRPTGSARIVEYHNALNPQTFVKKLTDDLRSKAVALLKSEPMTRSTRHSWANLLGILEDPYPVLRPVRGTDRAYSLDPSLVTVRRDLRKVLTRNWYEYDLRSAGLATAAATWRVRSVNDFLRDGGSFWEYLSNETGLSVPVVKAGCKRATYAVIFGAKKATVLSLLKAGGLVEAETARFWNADLVRDLVKARERRIGGVLKRGGLTTVFGEKVEIPSGGRDDQRRAAARSALAKQVQAVEVKLMLPIYELDPERRSFTIALYQFDGVSIQYRNRERTEKTEKLIQDAVVEEARRLKVYTELEGSVVE